MLHKLDDEGVVCNKFKYTGVEVVRTTMPNAIKPYVKKIIDNKDSVISSLLLSNNLVNILASSLATAYLYDLFGASGIFYATIIMTILIVIFAEVLPKIYSINRPNRTALFIGDKSKPHVLCKHSSGVT